MRTVRIAAAQTVEVRGDIEAAMACAADIANHAMVQGAALLCFPEGFLQGYLTEAELAREHALDLASPAFAALADRLPKAGPMIVMGIIEAQGDRLFNTAVVLHRGAVIGRYRKTHLLGSERCFEPGEDYPTFEVEGLKFGINICFDTNFPDAARRVADQGCDLIVCPANNMLPRRTAETFKAVHNTVRGDRCRETGLWQVSADVTGARDDRVAWGPTAVLDPQGQVVAQLPLNEPGLLIFDLPIECVDQSKAQPPESI